MKNNAHFFFNTAFHDNIAITATPATTPITKEPGKNVTGVKSIDNEKLYTNMMNLLSGKNYKNILALNQQSQQYQNQNQQQPQQYTTHHNHNHQTLYTLEYDRLSNIISPILSPKVNSMNSSSPKSGSIITSLLNTPENHLKNIMIDNNKLGYTSNTSNTTATNNNSNNNINKPLQNTTTNSNQVISNLLSTHCLSDTKQSKNNSQFSSKESSIATMSFKKAFTNNNHSVSVLSETNSPNMKINKQQHQAKLHSQLQKDDNNNNDIGGIGEGMNLGIGSTSTTATTTTAAAAAKASYSKKIFEDKMKNYLNNENNNNFCELSPIRKDNVHLAKLINRSTNNNISSNSKVSENNFGLNYTKEETLLSNYHKSFSPTIKLKYHNISKLNDDLYMQKYMPMASPHLNFDKDEIKKPIIMNNNFMFDKADYNNNHNPNRSSGTCVGNNGTNCSGGGNIIGSGIDGGGGGGGSINTTNSLNNKSNNNTNHGMNLINKDSSSYSRSHNILLTKSPCNTILYPKENISNRAYSPTLQSYNLYKNKDLKDKQWHIINNIKPELNTNTNTTLDKTNLNTNTTTMIDKTKILYNNLEGFKDRYQLKKLMDYEDIKVKDDIKSNNDLYHYNLKSNNDNDQGNLVNTNTNIKNKENVKHNTANNNINNTNTSGQYKNLSTFSLYNLTKDSKLATRLINKPTMFKNLNSISLELNTNNINNNTNTDNIHSANINTTNSIKKKYSFSKDNNNNQHHHISLYDFKQSIALNSEQSNLKSKKINPNSQKESLATTTSLSLDKPRPNFFEDLNIEFQKKISRDHNNQHHIHELSQERIDSVPSELSSNNNNNKATSKVLEKDNLATSLKLNTTKKFDLQLKLYDYTNLKYKDFISCHTPNASTPIAITIKDHNHKYSNNLYKSDTFTKVELVESQVFSKSKQTQSEINNLKASQSLNNENIKTIDDKPPIDANNKPNIPIELDDKSNPMAFDEGNKIVMGIDHDVEPKINKYGDNPMGLLMKNTYEKMKELLEAYRSKEDMWIEEKTELLNKLTNMQIKINQYEENQ